MKFSCIFVITFWCTLYISDNSAAVKLPTDESFIIPPVHESSNAIIEENSETDTSDMQRKKKPKTPTSVKNCLDLKKQGKGSGTYLINPCDDTPSKTIAVSCDMNTDGGGWTVIQRRDNYPQQQDFYNTWIEYSIGFGDVSRDFWLGNDNIHCLTKQSYNEIRFDLEAFDGNKRYAVYGFFYIGDETDLYKLSIQNYTGNAGDSFTYHNNRNFSTYDADHDAHSSVNCAKACAGGWWYNTCHASNLNGIYNVTTGARGVTWVHFKGHNHPLRKTEMKIRPKY